jgi:hypothetical protein
MTYFLRGALLSSGAFFLIYVMLSIAVAAAWRLIGNRAAELGASLLYGLRAFPLAAAVVLAIFFVIPSFLYLEPYRTSETVGFSGLVLASGGIVVVGFGVVSALFASWKTARFVASCPRIRLVPHGESGASAVEVVAARPMLLVAGIHRPKLLISEPAVRLLDDGEMKVAIRHELAHVSFHDNFKKLVLRAARFPFLAGLERSGRQAAEIAADDVAATDESSAVDLASASLKVASQTSAPAQVPDLAMSLDTEHALHVRIERLLEWQPRADSPPRSGLSALFIFCGLASLAVSYGPLLRYVHEMSELLIR